MDRVNPIHGRNIVITSNHWEGLNMARITFRGYSINLRFIRATDVWQLELEKGEHLKTIAVGRDLTLIAIENIAFKEIDKLIEEEKNSH